MKNFTKKIKLRKHKLKKSLKVNQNYKQLPTLQNQTKLKIKTPRKNAIIVLETLTK